MEENNCKHEQFLAQCKVGRITKSDDDPTVIAYTANIQIRCSVCGQQFEFIGVPGGSSKRHPTSNVDFTELRAPIRPATGNFHAKLSYEFTEGENTDKGKIN